MFGVFLKQKIANQPLTVVGSGNQKRDFTYVTDVVNAFYKGLYYSCNINILNVGTGKPISINKIVKLLNSKKVTIPKRPGEPDITNAKISKIKREMKWVAKIKIKEGINLLLNDINYWSKAPLWNQKKIKLATKDWFKYLK